MIKIRNKGQPFIMKAFSDKNYPLTLGDNEDKVSIKIDFETQEGTGQFEIFFDEDDIDYLTARQTKIGRKIDYKKKSVWMQNNWGLKDNPFNPDTNQPVKGSIDSKREVRTIEQEQELKKELRETLSDYDIRNDISIEYDKDFDKSILNSMLDGYIAILVIDSIFYSDLERLEKKWHINIIEGVDEAVRIWLYHKKD